MNPHRRNKVNKGKNRKYFRTPPYVASQAITEVKITEAPKPRSVSGYGSQLPTQYMIKIWIDLWKQVPSNHPWCANAQWRRVYAICWSNVASHYVVIQKQRWFLRDWDLNIQQMRSK